MKKLLMCLFMVACNSSAAQSKLDVPAQAPVVKKNVARDNALATYKDAKCDEIGFEEPELHSVRCTLPNGVKLYCTAGVVGTDCKPIYAPEEVLKAQAAQQEAAMKAQAAQAEAQAKAQAEAAKKTK